MSVDKRVEIDPAALAAVHEAQAKKLGVASLPAEGERESMQRTSASRTETTTRRAVSYWQ